MAKSDVQLTKPQLLAVLPLLARHLESQNYVTYTYAAITIDRILFIKQGNQLLWVVTIHHQSLAYFPPRFSQADIHDFAPQLIDVLLSRLEASTTPEKVAENDHLMKCKFSRWVNFNVLKIFRRNSRYCNSETSIDSRI